MSESNQNTKADVVPLDGPVHNPDIALLEKEGVNFIHPKGDGFRLHFPGRTLWHSPGYSSASSW
jgi:hypothetical protein